MKRAIVLVALVSAAQFVACGPDAVGEAAPHMAAERRPELYVNSSWTWAGGEVPVCWEDMNPVFATEREWVRQAVESTWQREAQLHFNRWDACDWYLWTNPQVRIRVADEWPHTANLGTLMGHQYGGMTLNFTFRNWGTNCQSNRQFCIQAIAVHEFGHALSFAHEQNRPDKPAWCSDVQRQGAGGDWMIGPWDTNSVMNYCNPNWNNGGKLSPGDIVGVQTVYGKRANSIVGVNGLCLRAPGGSGTGTTLDHCANFPDQFWMMKGPFPAQFGNVVGYFLDAFHGNDFDGTTIAVWTQNIPLSPNQQWDFADVALKGIGSQCVDISGSASIPGTPTQLSSCNGAASQRWTFTSAGEIRNASGLCLDAWGGSSADGTPVDVWPCHGGPNQKWWWSGSSIVGIGGKCLDAWSGSWADGTPLALYTCHGGLNQRFSMQGQVRTSQPSHRCIDGASAIPDPGSKAAAGSPVLWDCSAPASPSQTWEVFP